MLTKELLFNLIRKIRDRRLEPFSPLTLDDVKRYRLYLIQKDDLCTDVEKDEIVILNQLIRYYDRPYIDPDDKKDLKHVQLSIGFTDALFEHILPQLCNIISQEVEWVAVYHTLIYDGWMLPVDFYVWVKWLNDRLNSINRGKVLNGSLPRQICSYLRKSERTTWSLKEYQEAKGTQSKQSETMFKRLTVVCQQTGDILDEITTDKTILGSGVMSFLGQTAAL